MHVCPGGQLPRHAGAMPPQGRSVLDVVDVLVVEVDELLDEVELLEVVEVVEVDDVELDVDVELEVEGVGVELDVVDVLDDVELVVVGASDVVVVELDVVLVASVVEDVELELVDVELDDAGTVDVVVVVVPTGTGGGQAPGAEARRATKRPGWSRVMVPPNSAQYRRPSVARTSATLPCVASSSVRPAAPATTLSRLPARRSARRTGDGPPGAAGLR